MSNKDAYFVLEVIQKIVKKCGIFGWYCILLNELNLYPCFYSINHTKHKVGINICPIILNNNLL